MLNIALANEQEQRISNSQEALIAQIDLDTDLYSVGWFDGLIGCEPTRVEEQSYWEGYCLGQREYWAKRLGITLPTEL